MIIRKEIATTTSATITLTQKWSWSILSFSLEVIGRWCNRPDCIVGFVVIVDNGDFYFARRI